MNTFIVQENGRADFYFGAVEVRVWCYRERNRHGSDLKCKVTTDHAAVYPAPDSDSAVVGRRIDDDKLLVCGKLYRIDEKGRIDHISE